MKKADVWRELGMVDDPAKEIKLFFDQMERLHKNAQRYLKLVSKAYESYDEDLVARLMKKKRKDLHKKVLDMLDLGKTLVRYTNELDDLSRQQVAAAQGKMMDANAMLNRLRRVAQNIPAHRDELMPLIKAAMQKSAASVNSVGVVRMSGGTGLEITIDPSLTMYDGKIPVDAIELVAKKAKKAVRKTAEKLMRDRIIASQMSVDFEPKTHRIVVLIEIENPTEEDAEAFKKNLRV